MGYRLGVDLGTTYTAAAVVRDGRAQIVSIGARGPVVPSVIFLRDDDEILTGEAANRRAITEPGRVAREFKRRMGDPTPLLLGGSPMSPQALTAELLRWTVDQVAQQEGGPPDHIAVSHPANWGPFKLDLLQQAVRLADLESITTLTEPEAAAIYYSSTERVQPGDVVAVYDLGGGTFDAAVLRKTESGFEILGTPEGIEHLGGIDVDEAVFAHVTAAIGEPFLAIDPSDPGAITAVARLRYDCIEAKEALSSDDECTIPVMLPGVQTEVKLTRDELESMVRPWLRDTVAALRRALRSAEVEPSDLRAVLLVGGSSRMPLVSALVSEDLGRPVAVDAHPKHAVALGTALAAEQAAGPDEVRRAPATIVVPPPTPSAAAMRPIDAEAPADGEDDDDDDRRGALIVGGAAFGAGVAGTAGVAEVLGVGEAAAAGGATAAGVGPAGAALTVGPAGSPVTAGPAGTSIASGPAGSPLDPPANASKTGRAAKAARRRPRAILIGAVAGVAVAATAVAVVATRGDDSKKVAATASVPATVAGSSSTTTTLPPTAQRGLTGTVALVAGDGTDSGKGRPGPADQASLGNSARFVVAPDGDIFVINHENQVVLVHDGQMSLLYTANAPTGEAGLGGVAIGPDGDAYVTMGHFIRRVARDGTTQLIFDNSTQGPGGALGPIALDSAGNIYFYSANTYRVLRWGAGGGLSQVAGVGQQGKIGQAPEGDGGPALSSALAVPTALLVDGDGNLLIVDTGTLSVRKVASDGTITTIAGGGQSPLYLNGGLYAPDGTAATALKLGGVNGVAVDAKGRVYVADGADHIIFRFGTDGKIELVIADQLDVTEELGKPANQTRARGVGNSIIDPAATLFYTDSNRILTIEDAGK